MSGYVGQSYTFMYFETVRWNEDTFSSDEFDENA